MQFSWKGREGLPRGDAVAEAWLAVGLIVKPVGLQETPYLFGYYSPSDHLEELEG